MKKIGIIGAGFTGTLTAVQLIRKSGSPLELSIINERETFNTGVAYNPYSKKHLLNVITARMSAFADQPDHFLDWVMQRKSYADSDRNVVANAFLPRKVYGEYLVAIWKEAVHEAQEKKIDIRVIDAVVVDTEVSETGVELMLDTKESMRIDECILATGNHIPRNPTIPDMGFYSSPRYFRNPWLKESVQSVEKEKPILIVGNGLTMVDSVIGLLEEGFEGEIYAISPNGFNILPHRHGGMKYTHLIDELPAQITLFDLLKLVHKHIRMVRDYGVSAEPIIDSLRPHTQKIWRQLSERDKHQFMSRLRHLWGVARHRIPLHTHDKIQNLRIEGKLHVRAGSLRNFEETANGIKVTYFDRKQAELHTFEVARVINCTGPETDLIRMDTSFLKNCLLKGTLAQDSLKLGINTDLGSFRVKYPDGSLHKNLYTIGSSLKGELWETTAVNELRGQAEKLATILTEKLRPEKNQAIFEEIKRKN